MCPGGFLLNGKISARGFNSIKRGFDFKILSDF